MRARFLLASFVLASLVAVPVTRAVTVGSWALSSAEEFAAGTLEVPREG